MFWTPALILLLITQTIGHQHRKCNSRPLHSTRLGNEYKRVSSPNQTACYQNCLNDTECGAVTYNANNRLCHFMRLQSYTFLYKYCTHYVSYICEDRRLISSNKPVHTDKVDPKRMYLANDGTLTPNDISTCLQIRVFWEVDLIGVYRVKVVQAHVPKIISGTEKNTLVEVRENGHPSKTCSDEGVIDEKRYNLVGFVCSPAAIKGRYVKITPLGKQKRKVLCEVEIFGDFVDFEELERYEEIAKDKPITHSALLRKSKGSYVNNGINCLCFVTQRVNNPWLLIDTKGHFHIFMIRITNRMDAYGYEMYPLVITVGEDETKWNDCARYDMVTGTRMIYDFGCRNERGIPGQFVKLQEIGRKSLYICEMLVYALIT